MSIREKARETQRAEFEQAGDIAPPELLDLAIGVYDQIDSLSDEKRHLLIYNLVGRLGQIARDLDDPTERAMVSTLAGVAAYTNEVIREDADWTSTGDRVVDAVLDDLYKMLKGQFKALLGDKQPIVEAAAERVKARVEAGEDIETVAREEEAAMHAALAEAHTKDDGVEAPAASAARYDSGVYL